MLTKFLKIERGEIKPRYDWREIYARQLDNTTPACSYLMFQALAANLDYQPSAKECGEMLLKAARRKDVII